MICYMPFTYIEDRYIRRLTNALGPVSVYCPKPEDIPDHMHAWVQKGLLDARCPQGIHAECLSMAVREFKAWADLHQGNIADMTGYFKSRKGRPPLFDETNPTAIGDQIRKFGQSASQEPDDPIFQAALFLVMAQEYDQQHDAVAHTLGDVTAMEQVMLDRLAGDDRDLAAGSHSLPSASHSSSVFDAGAFMTAKRVQAWAELACGDIPARPYTLYVTQSPAVIEYILEQIPPAQGPLKIDMDTGADQSGHVLEALNALAFNKASDHSQDNHPETGSADLTVYLLAGLSPQRLPSRLVGTDAGIEPSAPSGDGPVNTLVGLLRK